MNRYNHPKHGHLPPNVRGILRNQSDDRRSFTETKEHSNSKKEVRTLLHQNLLECLREHRRESTKFMAYPDAYNKEHQIQNFISFGEKVKGYLDLAENDTEILIKNDALALNFENIQTASEMIRVCDAIEAILSEHTK